MFVAEHPADGVKLVVRAPKFDMISNRPDTVVSAMKEVAAKFVDRVGLQKTNLPRLLRASAPHLRCVGREG